MDCIDAQKILDVSESILYEPPGIKSENQNEVSLPQIRIKSQTLTLEEAEIIA